MVVATFLSILVASSTLPVEAQCASSNRPDNQLVGYNAIHLKEDPAHPLPGSKARNAFFKGAEGWNKDSCNKEGKSFPQIQQQPQGAGRTVTAAYFPGLNPSNKFSCGFLSGNRITLFGIARDRDNPSRTIPCTRVDILEDTGAHEVGHLLGLKHSGCKTRIMSEASLTPAGQYNSRRIQSDECAVARDKNQIPKEGPPPGSNICNTPSPPPHCWSQPPGLDPCAVPHPPPECPVPCGGGVVLGSVVGSSR